MTDKVFLLEDIASWTQDNSSVLIPAIQRGLVWKPRQVELLWDSILRGFPIGSFMLSDISDNPDHYYLMDGQQRFNAISLGYEINENPNAVLWLDIDSQSLDNVKTSRRYLVRVTTSAHPWGFSKNDECTPLNTDDRRKALYLYNLEGSIYNNDFSLKTTWPYKAGKPIPLHIFTSASIESREAFLKDIKHNIENSDFVYLQNLTQSGQITEEDWTYIREKIYDVFSYVKKYQVHCNHLSLEVLDEEAKQNTEDKSNLEILFERINVNGTRISNEDLAYSSIKAYWPEIRDINDELASRYMAPARLAMLSFRLSLTNCWAEKLQDSISLKQIRSLSTEQDKKEEISKLYTGGNLKQILNTVDRWIGVTDEGNLRTPSILRTLIAHKCSELYLLLMYWAKQSIERPEFFHLTDFEVRAIAFTIRWWSNNANAVIKEIMVRTSRERNINIEVVKTGIGRSMHDCNLLHIYSPTEVSQFFRIEKSPKWRVYSQQAGPWWEFFWRLRDGYWVDVPSEMLIYAEREYINSHFSNYDPARQDMWESYNRPWDFDHIIAQNRINNRQGEYREYDQFWLNSIGNIAAISFESNRSKSDSTSDYEEYESNAESLLFDPIVKELTDYQITYNAEQSYKYASSSFARLIKIYERVYEMIAPAVECIPLSSTVSQRKQLFNAICEQVPNAKAYLVAGNNMEFEITRDQDWCRQWISVGVVVGNLYPCICWIADQNDGKPRDFEIGIRKAPGTQIIQEIKTKIENIEGLESYNKSSSDWWYAYNNKYNHIDSGELVKEIERLIVICNEANND